MDLITEIAAGRIKGVEDRTPAFRQLVKRGFHQPGWPLRPGIDVRPRERAGKSRMSLQPEISRGLGRMHQLLNRPGLPRLRIGPHRMIGKTIESEVVGRMNRN